MRPLPSAKRTRPAAAEPDSEAEGSPVVVRAYAPHDRGVWNEFVRGRPEGTFFHLAEWQDVLQAAFGHRCHFLLAESDGQVVGVLPLAEVKSAIFGHALVSTPFCVYGGIVASSVAAHRALEQRACELALQLDVDYLEMRSRLRQHPAWPAKDLYVTFRKPIADSAEKNMLSIPRKQRAALRKGIQKGLSVEIDHTADRHYRLYSESLRNLGTPVFSRRYLDILQNAFGDSCEVLTVVNGDTAVSSVLSFYFRDEILPYYGGGSAAARSLAASDVMYWEVMERARQRGSQIFDFGRSKRDSGAFDFKKNWGFEPTPLWHEYFLVRASALPNLSPTNPKFAQLIRLWRRLPVRVSQLLGPPVAKYLG
jgi:FemAB-related protein (PEP-CTERM system-associated)